MTLMLVIQLIVLLAAIAIGARAGGISMGLWGGVGLAVLVLIFRVPPGAIPGEVLLIILAVIMAASAMEAAGGIDYLVRIASGIIRKSPKHVTLIAPVVAYAFTFLAGTGHIFYPLLPVIYEVAMKGRVRPERPIAVATIASQQAITASPVSAATAALIVVLGATGIGLVQILLICIPSTLIGVIVAALVQTRIGVELDQDPEYRRRVASGELDQSEATADTAPLRPGAKLSAGMFLAGVLLVVLCGLFPILRQVPSLATPAAPATAPATTVPVAAPSRIASTQIASAQTTDPEAPDTASTTPAATQGADPEAADRHTTVPPAPAPAPPITVSMPMTIAIVMLALAAIMLVVTKAPVAAVVKTNTCQAGITAVIGILGLAWLGDTFIAANKGPIIGGLSDMAKHYPASFAIGLFATSMLLYSQAATTKTLMPLGLLLNISPASLAAMFPAVNGYFFIPTYGTLIAAVNFDRSGTTRIGKYVLNHSFMIPGLISTIVAVTTGLAIAKLFF